MIDTQDTIFDAQLLAAFDSGPVKMGDVPIHKAAVSLRHVADLAVAAYAESMRAETVEAIDNLVDVLRLPLGAEDAMTRTVVLAAMEWVEDLGPIEKIEDTYRQLDGVAFDHPADRLIKAVIALRKKMRENASGIHESPVPA